MSVKNYMSNGKMRYKLKKVVRIPWNIINGKFKAETLTGYKDKGSIRWCAMFKQTWHLHTVITKQESMECQKVTCYVQTNMALTSCDYKVRQHVKSENDVPCSNRHGTYLLWLKGKRAWKVRKWCSMFKQPWHLLAVITKQESMESQKVMCHIQTDMALTYCDYKVRQHGKSESNVPCSNRHDTYPLWLQSKTGWKVRKWCPRFKQTWHLHTMIQSKRLGKVRKWLATFKQTWPHPLWL